MINNMEQRVNHWAFAVLFMQWTVEIMSGLQSDRFDRQKKQQNQLKIRLHMLNSRILTCNLAICDQRSLKILPFEQQRIAAAVLFSDVTSNFDNGLLSRTLL